MQKRNSSKCPKNWSLSLSEAILYRDTNHCLCSSFSSKSWSWMYIKSSKSTLSQFSHLHISVQFSPPFFRYLHLLYCSQFCNHKQFDGSFWCRRQFCHDNILLHFNDLFPTILFWIRQHRWCYMCWLPLQSCAVCTQNLHWKF